MLAVGPLARRACHERLCEVERRRQNATSSRRADADRQNKPRRCRCHRVLRPQSNIHSAGREREPAAQVVGDIDDNAPNPRVAERVDGIPRNKKPRAKHDKKPERKMSVAQPTDRLAEQDGRRRRSAEGSHHKGDKALQHRLILGATPEQVHNRHKEKNLCCACRQCT